MHATVDFHLQHRQAKIGIECAHLNQLLGIDRNVFGRLRWHGDRHLRRQIGQNSNRIDHGLWIFRTRSVLDQQPIAIDRNHSTSCVVGPQHELHTNRLAILRHRDRLFARRRGYSATHLAWIEFDLAGDHRPIGPCLQRDTRPGEPFDGCGAAGPRWL